MLHMVQLFLKRVFSKNAVCFRERLQTVDDWAAEKVLAWADEYLATTVDNEDNAVRSQFNTQYDLIADKLEKSRLWHQRLDKMKGQLAESEAWRNNLTAFWNSVLNWTEQDVVKQESICAAQLQKLFTHIQNQATAYPQFMRRVDVRLSLLVRDFVAQYKGQAAQYVADKVKSWDSSQMVDKLELSVGKDLQYIRINGTLVGGLVGLLIYIVSQYMK